MRHAHQLLGPSLLVCGLVALVSTQATGQDTDGDGIPDSVESRLGSPMKVQQKLQIVARSPDNGYDEQQAKLNAPDIVKLEACHVGGQRLLFRTTFAQEPSLRGANFILYADLDNDPQTGRVDRYHGGVDVMLTVQGDRLHVSVHNDRYKKREILTRKVLDGAALWMMLEAPLAIRDDRAEVGLHLLSQRPEVKDSRGDSTKHAVARLPVSAGQDPPVLERPDARGLALSDYRYHNDRVKLEKLKDKGLTYMQVVPAEPMRPGRPRPPVPFGESRKAGKEGTAQRERVPVQLLEESGVARSAAAIRFGFPMPQGALYDCAKMRVLTPEADEVPAQFTPTAFWPDDSLKWVLIDFTVSLEPKREKTCVVEFGSDVKRAPMASGLRCEQDAERVTVTTGPLKASIDKRRFNVLRAVWLDRDRDGKFADRARAIASSEDGVRLVNENGKAFVLSAQTPSSVLIEERGPKRIVVRVEGDYAAADGERYMSYITRLTFRDQSSAIGIAHTHVNAYVKTEFTDITSLGMQFSLAGDVSDAVVGVPDGGDAITVAPWRPEKDVRRALFQWDDQRLVMTSREAPLSGHSPGVVILNRKAGGVGLAVTDFWQRWPKGITVSDRELSVQFLPPHPNETFGTDLPHYLRFPFVEGKYRFKWGMSFTERIVLDVGASLSLEELNAETNEPVVPVLPAQWYARTRALGDLAPPTAKQFAAWDRLVEDGFRRHLVRKEQSREYGYLNYGDWYGERGRNWGNNEYDLAHGLFYQFLRTGDRKLFRWALTAARHQADVDCVHAYPDPYYVGANHQHSIGHTGTWSQRPQHATWSHRYDSHTDARNGHTWAEGMLEAWHLTGDARVMEAALGLGEHIAWGMSRRFTKLGSHERTAGWSLAAIMALYRATGDQLYLEAAERIAAVPLREQKLEEGGAWPHRLPKDHSGGHADARGNNLFLIGILLSGLKDYHEATGEPAVRDSIIAASRWILKSWDERVEGWPYSASPSGDGYHEARTSLNPLLAESLAYAGHLTGEEEFIRVAETAVSAIVRGRVSSSGKSLAQYLIFTGSTLALLQKWYEKHREDRGLRVMDGSVESFERHLMKTRDARKHNVRAPDEKMFWLKLTARKAVLAAERSPHGGRPKVSPTGTIRVLDQRKRVVSEGSFSADGPHRFRAALEAGPPGAVYQVIVQDDQRGVWSLSGENLQIVAQTQPGFTMGNVVPGRYHFLVPKGTKEFRVKLAGIHVGGYGGAVFSPGSKLAACHQGSNDDAVLLPWAPKGGGSQTAGSERGELKVKPTQADTGKVWSLVLWAANNIGCELEGVPPYLSLSREAWFLPKE